MSKAVRKNRRPAGQEIKKDNKKHRSENGAFPPSPAPWYNFQHTHFNMGGFTPQVQNRVNIMTVLCLLCSLRDPAVHSTDKWKIQIFRKGRPYEIWQHEIPRQLGYLIKQDGCNQNEQPQNRESVKGKQVLCHVEKKSDHTKWKRSRVSKRSKPSDLVFPRSPDRRQFPSGQTGLSKRT